jgi:hypothetical protein
MRPDHLSSTGLLNAAVLGAVGFAGGSAIQLALSLTEAP